MSTLIKSIPTAGPEAAGARSAALRKAWALQTLRRAIAAVGAASDQDYRDFGLDRSEIMARLHWLRDEIEHPGRGTKVRLTVAVVKRHPDNSGTYVRPQLLAA